MNSNREEKQGLTIQSSGRGKSWISIFSALALSGIWISIFSSCGPVGGAEEEIDLLINEGKYQLSQADCFAARNHFRQVLEVYDPVNRQAHLGMVLAEALELVNEASRLSSLFSSFGGASLLPQEEQTGNQQFQTAARGILENFHSKFEGMAAHLEIIRDDSQFSFQVDSAPVYVGEEKIVDLGGDYDLGDVYLVKSIVSLALGLFDQALSINLEADYLELIDFVSRNLFDGRIRSKLDFNLAQGFLVFLLHDPEYPEFLGFTAEGEARMSRAGELYGQALEDLIRSLELIKARTGTASSHLVYYQDVNGDGTYQEGEPLTFPAFKISAGAIISLELELTLEAEEGIKALADSFRFSEMRVSLARHLLPIFKVIFKGSLKIFGVSPALGEVICEGLVELVGDNIELQFNDFFQNPVSPRELLPAWNSTWERDDFFNEEGEFDLTLFLEVNRFLLEWEDEEAGIDQGHFQEMDLFFDFPGVEAIPADGLAFCSPYMPFQSPDFNQSLWVNLNGILEGEDREEEEGFQPAGLFEINVLIAHYYKFGKVLVDNLAQQGN